MKLSEAIRLGAMVRPQGRLGWMDTEGRCALACAAEALGMEPSVDKLRGRLTVPYEKLEQQYPFVTGQSRCHIGGMVSCERFADADEATILDVVWHLNDQHRWTREQIADWLETIEPAEEAAPVREASAELCVK